MTKAFDPPVSGSSLQELWAKAQTHDRDAVEEMASRTRALTLEVAGNLVRETEIEDLVQEVVLSILGSIRDLPCPGNFGGFVYFRSRAKASCIQSRRSDGPSALCRPEQKVTEENYPPPWSELIEMERLAALQACLEELPAKLRNCLQRRYANSESAREIARTLSLSHSSINARLHAGLASLNRCLTDKGVWA